MRLFIGGILATLLGPNPKIILQEEGQRLKKKGLPCVI